MVLGLIYNTPRAKGGCVKVSGLRAEVKSAALSKTMQWQCRLQAPEGWRECVLAKPLAVWVQVKGAGRRGVPQICSLLGKSCWWMGAVRVEQRALVL